MRILPVIFEDQQDGLNISIFWNKKYPVPSSQIPKQAQIQSQTQSQKGQDSKEEKNQPEKTEEVKESKLEQVDPPSDEVRENEQKPSQSTVFEPLAVRFLKTLIELLYLPGFTIDQPTSTSRTGFLLPLDHIW